MPDAIEELLNRMPLRRPPDGIDARVLAARTRRGRTVGWLVSAGVAAAAVLLAVALYEHVTAPRLTDPGDPAQVAEAPTPLSMERQWTHVAYEGVVAPDGEPMAKFRRRVVQQLEWIDPDDGARMEMTVPREDVILIKATVY